MAGLAIGHLGLGFVDLAARQHAYAALVPGFAWNRDWTIVATSAWFTIELIPAVLVWLCASRFARGFVLAMLALALANLLLRMDAEWADLARIGLRAGAVALLYLPAANPWFDTGRMPDATAS